MLAPCHGEGQRVYVSSDLFPPSCASQVAELIGKKAVCFQPEIQLSMIDSFTRRSLLAVTDKEIA